MRAIAILPAAGESRRMGQPKLLLPWGSRTTIEHVLDIWQASRVERVIVVVHPQQAQVAALAAARGAIVVRPEVPPAEMKVSIGLGLDAAECALDMRPADAWLLAPADMPALTAAAIDRVISEFENTSRQAGRERTICLPRFEGRRGHPVVFPWSLAAEVRTLAAEEGVNALLSRNRVHYVDVEEPGICDDFDTPEDYERMRARYEP